MHFVRYILLMVLFGLGNAVAAPMRFVYPPPEGAADKRYEYYWSILTAALESNRDQFGDYQLVRYPIQMNGKRAQAQLQAGGEPNVLIRTTSKDLETQLLPIRIPVDKGLTGYRLFLVMDGMQQQLERVNDIDGLRRFTMGQEVRWSDVAVLKAAGFKVATGDDYTGLFGMLAIGRFALFPRGINEIVAERSNNLANFPNLRIERRFMLYYPLPRYFFVARSAEGQRMAARIENGLWRLIRNGEFERRYQAFKADQLRNLDFTGRILFKLHNPNLPPETPLANRQLWDDLPERMAGVHIVTVPTINTVAQ